MKLLKVQFYSESYSTSVELFASCLTFLGQTFFAAGRPAANRQRFLEQFASCLTFLGQTFFAAGHP